MIKTTLLFTKGERFRQEPRRQGAACMAACPRVIWNPQQIPRLRKPSKACLSGEAPGLEAFPRRGTVLRV